MKNRLRRDLQNSIRDVPIDDQWIDELLKLFDNLDEVGKPGELARRSVLENRFWDALAQLAFCTIPKWVGKGPWLIKK
jgi:hypothetical protein